MVMQLKAVSYSSKDSTATVVEFMADSQGEIRPQLAVRFNGDTCWVETYKVSVQQVLDNWDEIVTVMLYHHRRSDVISQIPLPVALRRLQRELQK